MSRSDVLRLVPLGGFGEIGMNCLVLEAASRILIVDCGVMFPTPDRYGIDIVHPSFEYLLKNRDRIDGVVLTHGHEDHIAAIPYLLRQVDVPIYGAAYTLGLVEERMGEFDHAGKLIPRRLEPGGSATIGPFGVESFAMPHSIIDNMGLFLETPAGTVLHTSDFKLGLRGPDGGSDVLDLLRSFGERGVDLMISDSTGAEESEPAGDEGEVLESLGALARETTGRIYVAIFSSNIKRLEAVGKVAMETGRKLVLAGRSVLTHARVAAHVGAMRQPRDLVAPVEATPRMAPGDQLVVLSGTQGEERSALGKVAAGAHRHLKVEPGDLVVLSSRFIPGNEIAISRMIDRLLKHGARVVHRGNHPGVHVSGHGSREEISAAISAVAPAGFLPAHGTIRHMKATERLAREAGVASSLVVSNGEVVRLEGGELSVERVSVPVDKIYIDGGTSVPEQAMRDRWLLGNCGLLHAVWIADDDGRPDSPIEIVLRGVISEEATPWVADQARGEIRRVLSGLDDQTRRDAFVCSEAIRSALRKFMSRSISREPLVIVTIRSIDS